MTWVFGDEREGRQRKRNAFGACIKWQFTIEKARTKVARAYPGVAKE